MRNVVQVTGSQDTLVALCDDGTIWSFNSVLLTWLQLPAVPGQPESAQRTDSDVSHDRIALERQERKQQDRRERFEGRR